MIKISSLSLADRDEYVCRQSAAVMRACGYDMPEQVALDFLQEVDELQGFRFDVLQSVFSCIAFTLEHKRNDTPIKEAFENMLQECDSVHIDRLTTLLIDIANNAINDDLTPLLA